LLASGVPHEVRTTIHPNLLADDEIAELAATLHGMGVRNYALQLFRPQGCRNKPLKAAALAGYPRADVLQQLGALFPRFTVRRE
jgi:pyruvate-formate lyase-activating enzyme